MTLDPFLFETNDKPNEKQKFIDTLKTSLNNIEMRKRIREEVYAASISSIRMVLMKDR